MSRPGYPRGTKDPDLAMCRTTTVGSTIPGTARELYYCVHSIADCRFARAFGYDYLCTHQENHAFAAPVEEVDTAGPVTTSGNRSNPCSRPHICPYLSFAELTGCQCSSSR
jgi:hypothetical protein